VKTLSVMKKSTKKIEKPSKLVGQKRGFKEVKKSPGKVTQKTPPKMAKILKSTKVDKKVLRGKKK
jgi:hypothetical protein